MKFKSIIFFLCSFSILLTAQVPEHIQRYRDDLRGAHSARKQIIIEGNKVHSIISNAGEVGMYPDSMSFYWPNISGHAHLDGYTIMVGAEITTNNGIMNPIETFYREEMDRDPITAVPWGFGPLPGYFSDTSSSFARSDDPSTWPAVWPNALGLTPNWDGYWYGYFGLGTSNDVLESFYVMDDSRDREFTRAPYNYYPIQSDTSRGGIGLRVEVRSMQFTHLDLEDIVVWIYDIINISDYDYDKAVFGLYLNPALANKDTVKFDSVRDMVYVWGDPSDDTVTSYFGHAFLETPANPINAIDDDEDGMTDERQEDGIDNDNDWSAETDDLGQDGTPQTFDEGESDGIPTQGEPNFDITDKDEKDQLGLQSFALGTMQDKGPTGIWPKNDMVMWNAMNRGLSHQTIDTKNIHIVSACGQFPLKKWSKERFVVAMMCGEDLDDLMLNKDNIQKVYNNNFIRKTTSVTGDESVGVNSFSLSQNFPNPFNPSTNLTYRISEPGFVTLKIYDVLGKEITSLVNEEKTAGEYGISFNASNLASGVYYYTLRSGGYSETKKMVVLK